MDLIDYTEILTTISNTLISICVYCWGLLAWNIISHIRNRRETRKKGGL